MDRSGRAAVLDRRGHAVPGASAASFVSARMAYVYAIAALRGHVGARDVAEPLVRSLLELAGTRWPDREDRPDDARSLYTLGFVLLAASAATSARLPGGRPLLDLAIARLDAAFWDDATGLGVDRIRSDGERAAYRGLNANMHLVEALFAAHAAVGDATLRNRAVGICRFVIAEARGRDWRICEHYDASWRSTPDRNRDRPDHPFVPYGFTIGHGFEWSRLIAQADGLPGTAGFGCAAAQLFARAVQDGWARDGENGFLYTVDWSGRPVSRRRLHWVAAEAAAAASVLARRGDRNATEWVEHSLAHVRSRFVDLEHGSWIHDLDRPDGDKPDLYHAMAAVLTPQLPIATSQIAAIETGTDPLS
ncbi:AGE family epimerase/isomerase [uncultured Amnibacterium sp.]|uniref:AGE family epimerase/isomerase n=1 Tax=uncultured Amnibacterium sp. TaxID=1631851 RepID=UPI0035C961AF